MTKRRRQSLHHSKDQPIHHAAAGDPEELLRLLDAEPDLRDEPGWFWQQPIHSAAEAGNERSLEILVSRGADPNAEDGLHHDTPLIRAVETDSIACARLLLAAGANPDKPSRRGETPIFVARSLAAVHSLVDAGARLDVVDENGDTPFQNCASYVGSLEVLKFWVERGVDVNAQPTVGWPALHGVVGGGVPERSLNEAQRLEILDFLLDHGACVNLRDKGGVTALYYSCQSNLHLSACAELLLARGADPNLCDAWGCTALHYAARRGYADIVRILLEHGADPNLPNHHHYYPLDYCDHPELADRREELVGLLAPVTKKTERPLPVPKSVVQRLRAIPKYQKIKRAKCTKSEVDDLEARLGLKLPKSYRRFLSELGHGLDDFMLSDHWRFRIDDVPDLHRHADYQEFCDLPEDYFVFAERNGYFWAFFVLDGSADPPVFGFDDGEGRSYRFVNRTIWEFVDGRVIEYEHWYGE